MTHQIVEIRCFELPANLDQAVVLTTQSQLLVEAIAKGELSLKMDHDHAKSDFHEAAFKGPEARLMDHRGGWTTPVEFVQCLACDFQGVSMRLNMDLTLHSAASAYWLRAATRARSMPGIMSSPSPRIKLSMPKVLAACRFNEPQPDSVR